MPGEARFGVLGPVQVLVGEREATPTRSRLRELLALLLVRPGTAVRSSALIGELYGDRPPDTATTALQVHVSQLRKALRAAGDQERRLITVPGGYLIRVGPDELDLFRFERLAATGERLLQAGKPARAAAVLRDALGVWRGRALADVASASLVEVHAPRAEAKRLDVLERRIRAELAAGSGANLVPELRNLVTEHPLREGLRAQLVLALYRAGQQAAALAELAGFRALLAAELGVRPGPELAGLQRRILAADPELRPREQVRVRPPGAAPAPRPSAVVPAQLPPCPELIGREVTSAALVAAFDDDCPTVVAVGGAGTGTTAVVLSVAHRVADRYPGGQLFARAAGLPAGEVLGSFLRALGVPPAELPAEPARPAQLHAELAGRRVLLVLDDVPRGWGAAAVAPPPAGSALLMSATGELPELGAHARRVRVGPLERAEGLALLAAVLGDDRVRAELGAAAEIVERCGRLPLALRAIAAKVAGRPHWTLRAVAARLASPSGLLAELVAGDLCVRESLLRRYEACDEAQRRAFRQLAGLPGVGREGGVSAVSERTAAAVLDGTGLLDIAEVAAGAAGYRLSTVCSALAAELFGGPGPAGLGGLEVTTGPAMPPVVELGSVEEPSGEGGSGEGGSGGPWAGGSAAQRVGWQLRADGGADAGAGHVAS